MRYPVGCICPSCRHPYNSCCLANSVMLPVALAVTLLKDKLKVCAVVMKILGSDTMGSHVEGQGI